MAVTRPTFDARAFVRLRRRNDLGSAVRGQERAENFPVALRVLPAPIRADLHAVYAVARTIDDLGDRTSGDRTAQLQEFRSDLLRIWQGGRPRHPALESLVPTVRARQLAPKPFEDLIEANLLDQQQLRYPTFDDLRGYCRLSADPVGALVLSIFDQSTPAAIELSDRVCTALQLLEHWQDVAEDLRAGRIYVPQEDLITYGVTEDDLGRPHASPSVRALMRFEINRAVDLLESGAPIVGHLHGWAKIAVAGYVAGGRSAGRDLRSTGGDVLARPSGSRFRHFGTARSLLVLLVQHRTHEDMKEAGE